MSLLILLLLLVNLAGQSMGNQNPSIYDLTIGSKLVENQKFFLTCLASSGDQEVSFDWFLNGQKIVPNENVYVNQHEESSMLNIRAMRLELAGEFECRVSNRFGQDSRSIAVKLEGENFFRMDFKKLISKFKPNFWSNFNPSSDLIKFKL